MTSTIEKQSFGEGGAQLVASGTQIPAGQYCALSFVGGGGQITTIFQSTEAPLLSGTQTGITFPDGYTIYTPLIISAGSLARIGCAIVLYKAL